MSVNLQISTNERKLSVKLDKKKVRLTPGLAKGMRLALQKLRGQTDKDVAQGRFGLKTDTGALRRSLGIALRKRGDELIGFMGTGLPYAPAHEFGTTIRAKGSGFLTIPWPGIKGTARSYQNTFFHRFSAGQLILFQETGPRIIRPLFTLVKSVRVKPKKWMSKSFKATKKDLLRIMRKFMREAIAK